MRLLGMFVLACMVLAAFKAVIVALMLTLMIMVVWGVWHYPKEMFGLASYIAALAIFNAYPAQCLVFVAAAILLGQMKKNCQTHP